MDRSTEFDSPVTESDGGRKNRRKCLVQATKPNNKEPSVKCYHGIQDYSSKSIQRESKECRVGDLTYEDINDFHNKVKHLNKVDQDKFLLKYMTINSPKRRKVKEENSKRKQSVSIKYSIRNRNGDVLPICAASFQGIAGMSKDRLCLLARKFYSTGNSPKENRGGDRTGAKDKELIIAVKNDIKSYRCRESHYSRRKSSRNYLPPELNIKKMWKMFCEKREKEKLSTCSLSKYKFIFYKCFNLSFKTPHTDTCSTCKMGLISIKQETDLEKKNEYRTNYRLHKLRAKKFYTIMKEENPDVIKICFDMQQNQPLPKLSVGEAYYSRQVWFYNLCIMIDSKPQMKENIHFYTWLETESSKGCNQVASALLNFLLDLEKEIRCPSIIHLFSDSCPGQNKNSVVMTTLIAFLERSSKFTSIRHFFPIRGHSYMAPDRVFGRVEKEYRRKEDILSPNEYHRILQSHGVTKVLNRDWKIKTLKETTRKIVKAKLPFNIGMQRVISYKKSSTNVCNVSVTVQNTYTASPVEVSVFKSGIKTCHKEMLRSSCLQKMNMVSSEKKKDVKKLMQFFEIPEEAKGFYEDVLSDC